MSVVTLDDIRIGIRRLGLSGRPVCVHSSLRSFGTVDDGAETVVAAVLAEGCTLLVPTFSEVYATAPPPGDQPRRNGGLFDPATPMPGDRLTFSAASRVVDDDMGAIPRAVLSHPDHARGNHPLNSFTAVGPDAWDLVAGQRPMHVYAPLEELERRGGWIILMGVGLERMTLLHLAEQRAGRHLFLRWANDSSGQVMTVEVGSCSEGFSKVASYLAAVRREVRVGASHWSAFPVEDVLSLASAAIARDATLTRCDNPNCERCRDAVLGGPLTDG